MWADHVSLRLIVDTEMTQDHQRWLTRPEVALKCKEIEQLMKKPLNLLEVVMMVVTSVPFSFFFF